MISEALAREKFESRQVSWETKSSLLKQLLNWPSASSLVTSFLSRLKQSLGSLSLGVLWASGSHGSLLPAHETHETRASSFTLARPLTPLHVFFYPRAQQLLHLRGMGLHGFAVKRPGSVPWSAMFTSILVKIAMAPSAISSL